MNLIKEFITHHSPFHLQSRVAPQTHTAFVLIKVFIMQYWRIVTQYIDLCQRF